MSHFQDVNVQAQIAALERQLAELKKHAVLKPLTTVGGDQIEAAGAVVTRGSVFADHDSIAVAGSGNLIVKGNVYQGTATTDPAEALRIYRQVLVAGFRYLPLRGVDVGAGDPSAGQKPLNLAHVYIELDTRTQVAVQETPAKRNRSRKQAAPLREAEKTRPLPALEAVAANRRLVLLGDPGSGKSTFVGHLTHCLAAHALEPNAGWLLHLPGWADDDALPVTIVLRDFARWLAAKVEAEAKAEPSLVWEFLGGRLRAQNLAFVAEPLREALETGQAFLLFDGLDEIAGRASPRLVRDAVAAFAERYDRCRCLVTRRTLSYREADWQLSGYPTFELAPFDEGKIDRFVAAWYAELAEQGVVPAGDVPGLTRALGTALRRPDLWRLAPNPLLLTVMALVHTHKGRLPDARALLYEETVEILLWRWEQIKAGGGADETPLLRQLLLQADRGDVDLRRVLWKLAFEAHSQGGASGDGEAVADIGELRLLKELGGLCGGDLGWAQQVVEAMKLRAGLLVERQPEVFSFPHRTFQEYLAGAHLAAQADFARRAAALVAEGAHWREVILLAVGKLVYRNDDLDKPLALVGELCAEHARDNLLAWRKAWLAGDVLMEVGPSRAADGQLGRDLSERVRNRLAELVTLGKLDPLERSRAGDTLGRLGDPRPGVGLRPDGVPDLVWCDVPAGEFIMGSQDDKLAWGKETPWHALELPAYSISKYPITNAQFQAFVQDEGYTDKWRDCWTAAGWEWKGDRGVPDTYGEVFDLPNHPAVMVAWYEAHAFCVWLGNKLNMVVALPTEAQWEKAARGPDGRIYPWGENITLEHANYGDTGIGTTTAVGAFPKGASPWDALDMSGNVWEWTRSLWGDDWQKSSYNYPYADTDGREDLSAPSTVLRVLRGGAFSHYARLVRCACRDRDLPDSRYWYLGFRVIASPVS